MLRQSVISRRTFFLAESSRRLSCVLGVFADFFQDVFGCGPRQGLAVSCGQPCVGSWAFFTWRPTGYAINPARILEPRICSRDFANLWDRGSDGTTPQSRVWTSGWRGACGLSRQVLAFLTSSGTMDQKGKWEILSAASGLRKAGRPGMLQCELQSSPRWLAVVGEMPAIRALVSISKRINGESYEELLNDPELRIYNPLPNQLAFGMVDPAAEPRKPGLCEKPGGADGGGSAALLEARYESGVKIAKRLLWCEPSPWLRAQELLLRASENFGRAVPPCLSATSP